MNMTKRIKTFPELLGTEFGRGGDVFEDRVDVVGAINVSDFCKGTLIADKKCLAIIGYGRSSRGHDFVHFKTLFKSGEIKSHRVTEPFPYLNVGREGLLDLLVLPDWHTVLSMENWGIGPNLLVRLVFENVPIFPCPDRPLQLQVDIG